MSDAATPRLTTRSALLAESQGEGTYDLAIIGGGATGLGIALDAAAKGFKVALFEAHDFAKGTSSRSTKLVHGGVRYLAQGDIPLVREALHERATLLRNAAHLAQPLAFVMPCYHAWQIPFYWTGLKLYDALAGRHGLGAAKVLSLANTQKALPNVLASGLKGAIQYWDGQFDDARLALALARTAAQHGAHVLNYCRVTEILHEAGLVSGLSVQDQETQKTWCVRAKCVINATGVWVDSVRELDDQSAQRSTLPMVAPSQGVHVVIDRHFMPTECALIIPQTSDGRVLFAVPWLGKVILGTTDTAVAHATLEPRPLKEEIDFLLREAAAHLQRSPHRSDVQSLWVGLRPLVKPVGEVKHGTKAISREHTILMSPSNLVSVTGGKWTTYRVMAKDTLAYCFEHGLLPTRQGPDTAHLALVGHQSGGPVTHSMAQAPGLAAYGDEQPFVQAFTGAQQWLTPGLSEAMVRFAAQHEYARTVEDVLARRSRLLFLDAKLAESLAEKVGHILQAQTGTDPQINDFVTLAKTYQTFPD